jgi:hypothetical protein
MDFAVKSPVPVPDEGRKIPKGIVPEGAGAWRRGHEAPVGNGGRPDRKREPGLDCSSRFRATAAPGHEKGGTQDMAARRKKKAASKKASRKKAGTKKAARKKARRKSA